MKVWLSNQLNFNIFSRRTPSHTQILQKATYQELLVKTTKKEFLQKRWHLKVVKVKAAFWKTTWRLTPKNHELELIKLQNKTLINLLKTLDYQQELIDLKKAEIEDLKLQKSKIKFRFCMVILLGLFLTEEFGSFIWFTSRIRTLIKDVQNKTFFGPINVTM